MKQMSFIRSPEEVSGPHGREVPVRYDVQVVGRRRSLAGWAHGRTAVGDS
jgi:hypothetical protein